MNRICKVLVMVLLPFAITKAYSQPILKNMTEDFSGGRMSYQYYEDKNTSEHIKHGAFKFIKALKEAGGTHNTIIIGQFKDGNRHGVWTFSIKELDFPNGGGSFSTEITTATQTFKDGMPNGKWLVDSRKKARNKYFKIWRPFTTINNVSASTFFKEGRASGITVFVRNGISKTINLNKDGRITSNIIVPGIYDNTELFINKYGILTKHIERSKIKEPIKIVNYNVENIKITENAIDGKITEEEFQNAPFELKTVRLFGSLDFSDIFEHDYFLLPTLGGDKTFDGTKSQSDRIYGYYLFVGD